MPRTPDTTAADTGTEPPPGAEVGSAAGAPSGREGSGDGGDGAWIDGLRDRLGANPTVMALSLARLGDGVGNSLLLIALPLYVAEVAGPSAWSRSVLVGVLVSLFGLANVAAQPVAATLVDRVGHRKRWIQAGLAVMGVGTAAFLFASSYPALLGIRAFQAVGFALTLPASMALITVTTERRNRGGAMGIFATFRMVGFAVGPLLGGWLHVVHGFDAVFLVGAATILSAILFVEAWVEEPAEGGRGIEGSADPGPEAGSRDAADDLDEEGPGSGDGSGEGEDPAGAASRRYRFFDRELMTGDILSLGAATLVMATAISMMTTLENEFNARLNQTALGFGVAFSALTITRLVFQVPLGSLSDRIGRKPLVIAGLVLLAPATAWLGVVESTLELTGARLVQGLATAGVASPAFALAGDLSSEHGVGRQLSVLTMGFALGLAVGPLLAGLLAVVDFRLPFLVGGAMTLAAAALVGVRVEDTVRA